MQDLSTKVSGDSLGASEWDQVASEIQNVITSLGVALSAGDLNQLAKAIAGYVANGTFYTDSGVANAYVISAVGSKKTAPAYTNGFLAVFRPGNTNTGASTVNVAALGVKAIKTRTGTDVVAGDLSSGTLVTLYYDLANDWFELVNVKTTSAVDLATVALVDANFALTSTEEEASILVIPAGTLTAARTITCSNLIRSWAAVVNRNAFAITLKTVAGTGITIPAGLSMPLACDGTNVVNSHSESQIQLNSPVAITGAQFYDITGVPDGISELSVHVIGMSLSGTALPGFQVIVSGSPVTTGYAGGGSTTGSSTNGSTPTTYITSGGGVSSAVDVFSGTLVLTRAGTGSNTWVYNGQFALTNAAYTKQCAGSIALAGAIQGVRFMNSGTDTIDAGSAFFTWKF